MRIENIRLGHATNSSSNHSIICFNPKFKHNLKENIFDSTNGFGWEDFTLTTVEEKTKYIISNLYHALSPIFKGDGIIPAMILNELFPNEMKNYFDFNILDVLNNNKIPFENIDHQSILSIPKRSVSVSTIETEKYLTPKPHYSYSDLNDIKSNPKYDINYEFLRDLVNFVKNENVVIFGGNDNDDSTELIDSLANEINFDYRQYDNFLGSYSKTIKDGKYWKIFNVISGAKVTFTFDNYAPPYTKSSVPELVDLKITNMCKCDCNFCYQNSHKNGNHAGMDNISHIANVLHKFGVLEVAIGGGDPLEHPEFYRILNIFSGFGIVPSFSTKNYNFFYDESFVKIYNTCGRMAFSISNMLDFENFMNSFEMSKLDRTVFNKISLHIIPEMFENEELLHIAKNVPYGTTIVFLGYKPVGRGIKYGHTPNKNYKDVLRKFYSDSRYDFRFSNISLDTCAAKECEDLIKELNIPNEMYKIEEGKFSCYIDAVDMKMAKSSYDGEFTDISPNKDIKKWDVLDYLHDRILKVYKTY